MLHSNTTCRIPAGANRPPLRVGVILAHHFTLSAFAVFVDHLRLAADEGDRSRPLHVQWSIMASNRNENVPASCGVMLEPTSALLPPETLDYVVVIGGILCAMIFSLLVFPLIFAWAYRNVDTKHQGAIE